MAGEEGLARPSMGGWSGLKERIVILRGQGKGCSHFNFSLLAETNFSVKTMKTQGGVSSPEPLSTPGRKGLWLGRGTGPGSQERGPAGMGPGGWAGWALWTGPSGGRVRQALLSACVLCCPPVSFANLQRQPHHCLSHGFHSVKVSPLPGTGLLATGEGKLARAARVGNRGEGATSQPPPVCMGRKCFFERVSPHSLRFPHFGPQSKAGRHIVCVVDVTAC